jgi:hypothetical protein
LPNANRFGDLRRSTLSWCRRTRISASNSARDRNTPIKAHQINLQRSLIGSEYRPIRGQPYWVCGRDTGSRPYRSDCTAGRTNSGRGCFHLCKLLEFGQDVAMVLCEVAHHARSRSRPFGDDPSRKDQFTIDRSTPPFDLPTILQISRPSKMELFDHSCPNLILTAPS